jgi:hypothetical protein
VSSIFYIQVQKEVWFISHLEAARRQLNLPPKPVRKKPILAGPFQEYRDQAGICRVCGKPAPPPSAARQDGLHVYEAIECREEARELCQVAPLQCAAKRVEEPERDGERLRLCLCIQRSQDAGKGTSILASFSWA